MRALLQIYSIRTSSTRQQSAIGSDDGRAHSSDLTCSVDFFRSFPVRSSSAPIDTGSWYFVPSDKEIIPPWVPWVLCKAYIDSREQALSLETPLQTYNMRLTSLAFAASITPALASWIPSAGELIQDVDQYLHSSTPSSSNPDLTLADSSLLSVERGSFGGKGKKCTLRSGGDGADDTENFLKTVKECGKGGILHLPDPV